MTDDLQIKWLDAALGGDIESYGRLCERYYNAMAAVAYSVLGDHHLAEDAAQEAFAKALLNLNKLKNRDKFGPWLAQICRNTAKDIARKQPKNFDSGDFPEPADEFNNDQQNDAVTDALNRLPQDDREMIILRYYNELSHERIGDILGLSKAAVNNRLVRIRKKLEKLLKMATEFTENKR